MTNSLWPAFTLELASTLVQLDDQDIVIVDYRGLPVVQFVLATNSFGRAPALNVEAFSDGKYPEDRKYGADGRQCLAACGWQAPAPPNDCNWRMQLAWPFTGQAAMSLAETIVRAVREVYAVTGPELLRYEGFNGNTNADLDLPLFRAFPSS